MGRLRLPAVQSPEQSGKRSMVAVIVFGLLLVNWTGEITHSTDLYNGLWNSFFDVFYEIRVGDNVFHPARPVHMAAVITHKPPGPGDTYINPFTEPVDLLDANGKPTGIKILKEVHTPMGKHKLLVIPFPEWVPKEILEVAQKLTEKEAASQLAFLL